MNCENFHSGRAVARPSPSIASFWPPPASGSMASQNFAPPYPMQYRPGGPPPPQVQQQYTSAPFNQQYHPSQAQNIGMLPGQSQPPPLSQPVQQYLSRTSSYPQMNMPIASSTPQPHPSAPSHGVSFPSPYTFAQSSYGLPQNSISMTSQFQPSSQISAPVGSAQPWLHANQTTSVVAPLQQAFPSPAIGTAVNGSSTAQQTASDWQEYEATDLRRYYYNKTTKQSSWEKPVELMTPLERADASTVWKEFTTPEGRKYYYNKETKQSKWTIPDELKLAREQAQNAAAEGANSETKTTSTSPITAGGPSVELPSAGLDACSTTSTVTLLTSSPTLVTPIGSDSNVMVSELTTVPTSAVEVSPLRGKVASSPAQVSLPSNNLNPVTNIENPSTQVADGSRDVASVHDIEGANKGMAVAGKINETPLEEKTVDDEPFLYASKQEAKNAFKALLESANVAADWSWDQAMRVIINDKRYGALKTLGERKQAFNEYMMQRKKVEAEERRFRQRKAKEEYIKMLEESRELTSSTRWSKAVVMFEDDERFKAVEHEADREDLFRNFLVDLQKKERAKAQEEYRQKRAEFRQFLEACDFIKVDSQWRKVQDLLEEDEKCTLLDKIDRLDVFQDYIRDLEKEEDELKKRQKEQLRRTERKNRDAFRKMMDEHIADGTLTAKTHWRDYCLKVKESEVYEAVATNTSGSTPKDLFEDVTEELEKKYDEDKSQIKDVLKQDKIVVSSTWTFEDFKSSIKESSTSISDINLKLVYEDLIDRAKEKEEKEAKKRKRLAKDFTDKLSTIKEIDESSSWEESKQLFEDSSEYRSIGDESLCMEIFNEYVSRLQEKLKEKERKREEEKAKKERERDEKDKRKEKDRREKDKERDKDREREREKRKDHKDELEREITDLAESHGHKDDKKREKDKERKHRKRHQSTNDDVTSDKDDKEEKKSRRHGSDCKKTRKHSYSSESDSGSRHKRHKRDIRDGSTRNAGNEELEDGELGEDGEIQ